MTADTIVRGFIARSSCTRVGAKLGSFATPMPMEARYRSLALQGIAVEPLPRSTRPDRGYGGDDVTSTGHATGAHLPNRAHRMSSRESKASRSWRPVGLGYVSDLPCYRVRITLKRCAPQFTRNAQKADDSAASPSSGCPGMPVAVLHMNRHMNRTQLVTRSQPVTRVPLQRVKRLKKGLLLSAFAESAKLT